MQCKIYLFILLLSSIITTTCQKILPFLPTVEIKASVSERIGITDVTIHNDRPAVKGREGEKYGANNLVHTGFMPILDLVQVKQPHGGPAQMKIQP